MTRILGERVDHLKTHTQKKTLLSNITKIRLKLI